MEFEKLRQANDTRKGCGECWRPPRTLTLLVICLIGADFNKGFRFDGR